MEANEVINTFNGHIDTLIKRVQVNHVVFTSRKFVEDKSNFKEVDKFLAKNKQNKIVVNSAIFLNSLENPDFVAQQNEDEDLVNVTNQCSQFINEKFSELFLSGENLYQLNELIGNTLKKLDIEISQLDYNNWLIKMNPNQNQNVFFLSLNKERKSYLKFDLDIETFTRNFFEHNFISRSLVLVMIQKDLINLFIKYLVLPRIDQLPSIEYSCQQTDICELLYAIALEKKIDDSEKLKAILMEMFEISKEEYNNAIHEIAKRVKSKSKFMNQLADNLNTLPAPKRPAK